MQREKETKLDLQIIPSIQIVLLKVRYDLYMCGGMGNI